MNKQEEILNRLEAARQIIRFDYPFEYNAYGQWRNPRLGVDALRYVANGYDVRMKPLPDKWADLKKAHADGKTIQWKYQYPGEAGHLWRDTIMPIWKEGTDYRIKPESIRVPLGPEDVPPGSVFKSVIYKHSNYGMITPLTWMQECIEFHDSGNTFQLSYEKILYTFLINRSLSNGKWDPTAWEPCYKEVTEQ